MYNLIKGREIVNEINFFWKFRVHKIEIEATKYGKQIRTDGASTHQHEL